MSVPENKAAAKRAYEITVDKIPGPDFTTYWTNEEMEPQILLHETVPRKKQFERHSRAISCNINPESGKPVHARGLLCSAYGGTNWSLTLRCDEQNNRKPEYDLEKRVIDKLEKYSRVVKQDTAIKASLKGKAKEYLGYFPVGSSTYAGADLAKTEEPTSKPSDDNPEIFLNHIQCLCQHLYDVLFPDPDLPPSGLIAVTGATDSSKSLITRGLIFLFLQTAAQRALEKKLRKPHLVTFEDPIEQYYIKNPASHVAPDSENLKALLDGLYLDYTPREKGLDAFSLDEVIKDALRQTPALLFVGETREEKDWQRLLEFAGSGHLVVTTSHAGSVVEAMSRIFRDTGTETAAQRSEISRRILGIINIRSFSPRLETKSKQPKQPGDKPPPELNIRSLIPALWRRTPQSVNNLIADGLAALVPALEKKVESGYYSRTYFIEKLTAEMTSNLKESEPEKLREILKKQARKWDLEGG